MFGKPSPISKGVLHTAYQTETTQYFRKPQFSCCSPMLHNKTTKYQPIVLRTNHYTKAANLFLLLLMLSSSSSTAHTHQNKTLHTRTYGSSYTQTTYRQSVLFCSCDSSTHRTSVCRSYRSGWHRYQFVRPSCVYNRFRGREWTGTPKKGVWVQ